MRKEKNYEKTSFSWQPDLKMISLRKFVKNHEKTSLLGQPDRA